MKLKIPNTVQIGTYRYNIVLDHKTALKDSSTGTIDHIDSIIRIDPHISVSMRTTTFLHELIHLIESNYGIDISDSDVSRLSHGMAEFLGNNLGIEFDWQDVKETSDS